MFHVKGVHFYVTCVVSRILCWSPGRHGLSAKHLPLLRDKGAGATLFHLTSSSFLNAVRRMLTMLDHKDANSCTLKAGPLRLRQPARLWASSWQQVNGNPLRSSGTARPMRSPSLPSSRWCALKTRTECIGGGKGPRGKPKGTDGKECRWNRHAKRGIGGGPVSVTMVSRVCSVIMVTLVAGTPFGTGGYPACYQCGVASAQCGGIGSPGAVVPLCQVTLLASSPSLHHAYHGSLVTPSVCFWTSPLCLPVPVCVMCDVTTCGERKTSKLPCFFKFVVSD